MNNQCQFALDDELLNKCKYLYAAINEYNSINTIKIAHAIIVDVFKKGYAEIYGSVIDGVTYHSDTNGNEWEEEILAEPVRIIEELSFTQDIENLLLNEGFYSEDICVDEEGLVYVPIYSQLKRIYQQSLDVVVNGKKYVKPQPVIKLTMLPEEYISVNYDFFEAYNNDNRIKRKNELREEIVYNAQAIVQDLKERIEKIIKKYEFEEIWVWRNMSSFTVTDGIIYKDGKKFEFWWRFVYELP